MNEDALAELDLLPEPVQTRPELVLADRCDQCPNGCSQAFVRAFKVIDGKEMDLLFCAHHATEHEPSLIANEWAIQDERHKINSKPMSGAPESALTSHEE